jgi:hypothetical protein
MTQNKKVAKETKTDQDSGRMNEVVRQLGIILAVVISWLAVLGLILMPSETGGDVEFVEGQELTWETHVLPIMQDHCILCHGASGGLSLATYEAALEGGVSGPAIVPGEPQESLLYLTLLGPVDGIPAMPLGQPPLSEDAIQIIEAWIEQLPSR